MRRLLKCNGTHLFIYSSGRLQELVSWPRQVQASVYLCKKCRLLDTTKGKKMQAKDACILSQANVVLWGCHRTWLRLCRCAVIAVGTILEIEPHNCQILKRVAAEAEVDPDANKNGRTTIGAGNQVIHPIRDAHVHPPALPPS